MRRSVESALASPQLFTPDEFGPNARLFDVFSLSLADDKNYESIRRFARINEAGLLRTVDRMTAGLAKIEHDADSQE